MTLVVMPVGAHAAELRLTPRSQVARPGQLVKLRVTATAAGSCQLRVDTRRSRVKNIGARRFVISARVSTRARRGAHALSLRCSGQRAGTRIKVARGAGNRSAHGALFRGPLRISAMQQTPGSSPPDASAPAAPQTGPFARPILSASPAAQLWWHVNAVAIVTSFRNGQCTDWAQQRRPDIVQNAYTRRFDLFGLVGVVTSWDAKYWAINAIQTGIAVGHSPVVGAIMVVAPGNYGAGPSGHVAVVEALAANGSFVTSAMHAPNTGEVSWQTYSAGQAAAMKASPAITFIL